MRRLGGLVLTFALGCGGAGVVPQVPDDAELGARVTLRLTEAPDEGDVPQTQVQLVLLWADGVRQVLDVGTRAGACHEIQMPRTLPRVSCWWGPEQVEIEVVQIGTEVLVRAHAGEVQPAVELFRTNLRLPGPIRPWRAVDAPDDENLEER